MFDSGLINREGSHLAVALKGLAAFGGSVAVLCGGGAASAHDIEAVAPAEDAGRGSFFGDYSAGIEYDSNVAVLDIDASSTQSDFAAQFDLGVGYEYEFSDRTRAEVSYNFGQDLQFDVTEFSTQLHRGEAKLAHEVGDVTLGASYQLIYSRLDGAGFLRFHRFTPSIAGYAANKKIYWRGAYIYTDKNFIGRSDRDGEMHAGAIDAFYFLNGLKTYIIAGYRFEAEDTLAPEFDFDAHNFKFRFVQRVALTSRPSKLRLGFRYENRNYSSITPSIGEIRDDVRYRVESTFETPINDTFCTELRARYDILNSNLPSVDFSQAVVSVRLGGRF
ncbi:MAG: hypothetical protein AAFX08_06390 [Pseudomonadota bacterium]